MMCKAPAAIETVDSKRNHWVRQSDEQVRSMT